MVVVVGYNEYILVWKLMKSLFSPKVQSRDFELDQRASKTLKSFNIPLKQRVTELKYCHHPFHSK